MRSCRKTKVLTLFVLVICLVCGNLQAQFRFQLDYASRYIWRGFDLNPVKKPVLQPSAEYSFGESGLSVELWSSFSFVDEEAIELDLTIAYEYTGLKNVSLSAGLIHYGWYFTENFCFNCDTTHEVFAEAGLPNVPLHPELALYWDFHNGDGIYISLEMEQSFRLSEAVGIHLFGSLGYNGGQWLAQGTDPGFSDLNLGVSLPVSWRQFTFVPFAVYTFVLLDAIGEDNHFWFGLSVQVALD